MPPAREANGQDHLAGTPTWRAGGHFSPQKREFVGPKGPRPSKDGKLTYVCDTPPGI